MMNAFRVFLECALAAVIRAILWTGGDGFVNLLPRMRGGRGARGRFDYVQAS